MKFENLFEMLKDLEFMSKSRVKLIGRCYGNKLFVNVSVNGFYVGIYALDELHSRMLDFYYLSYALGKITR